MRGRVVLPLWIYLGARASIGPASLTAPNAYNTIYRISFADDNSDTSSTYAEEYAVNRPRLPVDDGCQCTPPPRSWFRLDDSTSGVLTILGPLIRLPGLEFGVYRKCRTGRMLHHTGLDDVQALPLVVARGRHR